MEIPEIITELAEVIVACWKEGIGEDCYCAYVLLDERKLSALKQAVTELQDHEDYCP